MSAQEQGEVDLAAEFEKDLPEIITLQGDDPQGHDLRVLMSVPNMNHTLILYEPDLDNTSPATPVTAHTSGQHGVFGHQFYIPNQVTSSPLVISADSNASVTPAQQNKSSASTNSSPENISPKNTSKAKACQQKSKHRKRRVVVSPRNKYRKLAGANDTARRSKKPPRSSSSSYAPTSSPASSDTSTPPRTKKRAPVPKGTPQNHNQEAPHGNGGSGSNSITISRFQCRVCGQTRFLALVNYVGLPMRMCECGSSAVSVASWVRVARGPDGGLAGGGLGRECVRCSRCRRLYCSDAFLRRHHCSRQRRGSKTLTTLENGHQQQQDASQDWPGVCEVPTCSQCGEAFIFEPLLQRHVKREHLTGSN